MKLLRTIRLDPSDTFVFEKAAEPGEWAVSGAFVFWKRDPAALEGKARSAFRGGFLGVASLGWSTLVQIVEASDDDRLAVIDTLAQATGRAFRRARRRRCASPRRKKKSRSPSRCAASRRTRWWPCIAPSRTARCAKRSARCVRATGQKPARAFSFLEVEGEDEQPDETVDLVGMAERERK